MTNIMRVMDGKVVGIEVAHKLGIGIPQSEIQKYSAVPFSEVELRDAHAKGLILVAMPSVNLLDLPGVKLRWPEWEQRFEPFLGLKSRAGYHLLGELPNSEHKGWEEQYAMIPANYDVPYSVEMTYLALVWALLRNRPAFQNWVRCNDVSQVTQDGWHILVRANPEMFVTVDFFQNDYPDRDTSIAVGKYRPIY